MSSTVNKSFLIRELYIKTSLLKTIKNERNMGSNQTMLMINDKMHINERTSGPCERVTTVAVVPNLVPRPVC